MIIKMVAPIKGRREKDVHVYNKDESISVYLPLSEVHALLGPEKSVYYDVTIKDDRYFVFNERVANQGW